MFPPSVKSAVAVQQFFVWVEQDRERHETASRAMMMSVDGQWPFVKLAQISLKKQCNRAVKVNERL
jgi:hypothetical protein